jgi:hypothetical protein
LKQLRLFQKKVTELGGLGGVGVQTKDGPTTGKTKLDLQWLRDILTDEENP